MEISNYSYFLCLSFRSRRGAFKRTGSVDCFGVPVTRDPFRNRSQTISTAKYRISSYRRSSSTQSDPGRRLSKTFSIQILENDKNEDDRKSLQNDSVFDEQQEIKRDIKKIRKSQKEDELLKSKHPRFGQADYPTVISDNVLAHNDPFSWEPLQSQVAGHGLDAEMKTNNVPGVMITTEGQILKPVQQSMGLSERPDRGLTEVAFYSHIMKSDDPIDSKIRNCIPKFSGIEQFESNTNGSQEISNFLILEDITGGFELPVVMDIKIGHNCYGPDASPEKRARKDKELWPTQVPCGFKISGILSHSLKPEDEGNLNQDGKVYSKKNFGEKLTPDTIWKVTEAFYDSEPYENVAIVNEIFVRKLKEILEVFEIQNHYHIFGSSILFTYDANAVRKFRNGKLSATNLEDFVQLKLIDFANVYESAGETDANFVSGLRNLVSLFENFAR